MTTQSARGLRARRLLPGAAIAAAILLAGCSGASAAPSAAPATTAAASPASAGPATWADWIAHQGFGSSEGPNEVRRNARYISDNGGDEDLFNLDQDLALVANLIGWLDAHPATACWADYHTQVRADLVTVRDGWTKARPVVEKGGLVPADIVASGAEAANAANDLPAPANCP